jgi:hypothetical protein
MCHYATKTKVALIALLAALSACVWASPAAAVEAPAWQVTAMPEPTAIAPGSEGHLVLFITNVGGASSDGSTATITDELPAGLTETGAPHGYDLYKGPTSNEEGNAPLTCAQTSDAECTYSAPVDPGDTLQMVIPVGAEATVPDGSELSNHVRVSGGGALSMAAVDPVTISATPPPFGLVPATVHAALSTLQAGAHPNITSTFAVNLKSSVEASGALRDVRFDLPVGFVGNTVGMPQCTLAGVQETNNDRSVKPCPPDTIAGTATVRLILRLGNQVLPETRVVLVYNIAPVPGEPAAFAFTVEGFTARLDTSVLSGGDYGVRVSSEDTTEAAQPTAVAITVWGVPADHNGVGPDKSNANVDETFGEPSGDVRVPLLTNPTQCTEPLSATLSVDSWNEPGTFLTSPAAEVGTLTGCAALSFEPSLSAIPDTFQAGAPAGYTLDLRVPRSADALPEGVAAPDVKAVTVALPMGTVVSPSAATGLLPCTDEQFALHSGALGACPPESQIATVKITSPNIAEPLTGELFLGAPECDPCSPADAEGGHMIRLFLQARGEGEGGVLVKVEGNGAINQQTGQITATFENNPQLPFSDLKLTLPGGPRATLANPSVCAPATTTADLTPWSTPFTPDATVTSSFEVTGCTAPRFAPSFVAGTTSNQAGGFSPLTVAFGRSDADQDLNGIQMTLPPGLLGSIASVPLCRQAQAMAGTCGEESLIGSTQVLTGPGSEPFLVTGGRVFLTEGYKGAPYGLSIVVPAKAGPYTLSGTTGTGFVVVRAAINVDPHTAALTVTSDPLPSVLDGIPLALKVVNVTIGRPGFISNPTNCNPLSITGTLSSTQGASASVSSPFQVANCAALAFKPEFLVSTSGQTSKLDGASLDAKVIFPSGSETHDANIAKVKVDLPKQLPSRLTTLQKACIAATFEANPGLCPAASIIGVARASSPILPVQLTGPVYFVSHGGEDFPSLIMVLQGDGVRVDVVGKTFISHAGITSNTFNNVPDVPISSFELYLPEGRYSALGANANLCTSKLTMPTAFVAQNGTEIHQNTKITVTGCPKANKTKHKKGRATKARRATPVRTARGKGQS